MLLRSNRHNFGCALAAPDASRVLKPELLRRFHCRKGMGEACYKRGRRLLPEYYFTEHFASGRILALKSQPKASSLETTTQSYHESCSQLVESSHCAIDMPS